MRTLVRKKKLTLRERVVRNLKETWRNKIFGLAMVLFGIIAAIVSGDGTGTVFIVPLGIFIFFEKKDIWRNY